ncbi:hypothetical protein ACJ73_06440, partial [Blastomyces percursus]
RLGVLFGRGLMLKLMHLVIFHLSPYSLRTILMKVLAFHQKGISHGDISPDNISLGLHPKAFTDYFFKFDQKSDVILRNVSDLDTPPPRPGNLPEYIILRHGTPLKTNAQDMSLVNVIDFGKVLEQRFDTPSKSNVLGTENYSAPELERSGANTATAKSDLWSLGCAVG